MRAPVIIGGGPAGATAALALRKAGHAVTLIERSTGPTDKVCGDFLGASATRMSERLGLPLAALGALPVTHLRLIRRGTVTDSPLPFRALALSRRRFDEALLAACVAAGVDLLRGETVRPPRADSQDFVIRTAARGPISTGTLFLATGRPEPSATPLQSPRGAVTGYKMYLELRPAQRDALAGRVELMMLPHGQAALQRVEDDQVALCLLLRRREPEAGWNRILDEVLGQCPHLARRLAGAAPLLARPVIAPNIPFGFLHRGQAMDHDGLYRIGDQAAVPSSLVADGVSVAIRSAMRATQSWLSGAGAAEHHRRLREMLWPRMRLVAHYDPASDPAPRVVARAGDWRSATPARETSNAPISGPTVTGPTVSGANGMSANGMGFGASDPRATGRGAGSTRTGPGPGGPDRAAPTGPGRTPPVDVARGDMPPGDMPPGGVPPDDGPPVEVPLGDVPLVDLPSADLPGADPLATAAVAPAPAAPPTQPPGPGTLGPGPLGPGTLGPGTPGPGTPGPDAVADGGSAAGVARESPKSRLSTRWDRLTA